MNVTLEKRLEGLIGRAPTHLDPVGGGDLGTSYCARQADGPKLFVKEYKGGAPDIAAAEARGLTWLADARALAVARVVAVEIQGSMLVLEWIESGPPSADAFERFGRKLSALHAAGSPIFGHSADNYLGPIRQNNAPVDDWPSFYGERRIRPLLRLAQDQALVPSRLSKRLEGLIEKLPNRCGPPEVPARLHGDLWRGNLMMDGNSQPVLIDPAAYGGHREVDLAMMRLFGGFPERAFEAYAECAPLSPGSPERVPLYQIYPLLVHVLLFGPSYLASLTEAVDAVA